MMPVVLFCYSLLTIGLGLLPWISGSTWHRLHGEIEYGYRWLFAGQLPWYIKADSHVHAVVAALLLIAVSAWCRHLGWHRWWAVLITAVVLITDESLQLLSPIRSAQWSDLICGFLGMAMAWLFMLAWWSWHPRPVPAIPDRNPGS